MSDITFDSLAVVAVAAFAAPLVVDRIRAVRVPVAVIEIILGILIGPDVLGWAEVDDPVQVLALLGLAFVLFLAGFELDLHQVRGGVLRAAVLGYVCVLAASLVFGVVLDRAGLVDSAALAAILLSATSLALVTPVLREADQLRTHLGQVIMACASVSEFAAVALLSLLFTKEATGTSVRVALAGAFLGLILVVGLVAARVSHTRGVRRLFERLHGGTYQIRVRGSMMIMALFVVLAQEVGLEAILGALVAGALLGVLDHGALREHAEFRAKLDAVGYGFLAPAFFIWSGMSIDLDALRDQPSRIALIGLFFVAFLVVHLVALPLYRRTVSGRGALVAGLLGSTSSLPFVVTATTIGQAEGLITKATAAAMLVAGVLSALVFPVIALVIVRRDEMTGSLVSPPEPTPEPGW
jgi:Kef-type K+ transport system membrane component KefB